MNLRKLFIIFIIFILNFPLICFADDILEEDITEETIESSTEPITSEPSIGSKNVIVIDRNTLSVLYEKNGYEEVPMASTTKIMTCIIALENCDNLNEEVKISKKAAKIHGSTLGIKENTKMSMKDLIYGLMLRSRQ